MTGVSASTSLPLAAEDAWDLLTDVRNHARWVPFTRVDAGATLAVGDTFTGVTGPRATRGGGGMVDEMVVERSDPPSTAGRRPGVAAYRKLGPVLLGAARVVVAPVADRACVVTWEEDVHLRGLPRGVGALLAWLPARAMLALLLPRIRREVLTHPR